MQKIDGERLRDFLGSDPILGDEALEYFSALGPSCLAVLLPRERPPEGSPQADRRLAKLCRRFDDAAVPFLIAALRDGSWFTKIRAAACFDLYIFRIGDPAAGLVADLLESKYFEVNNAAMLALGFMGAYSWAFRILDIANPEHGHYSFGKLGGNALQALILMLARVPDTKPVGSLLEDIERQYGALAQHAKPTSPHVALLNGALTFGSLAADELVRKWLTHDDPLFREAALNALGRIGLRRTAPAVVERLLDTSEAERVRSTAGRCLGEIGGPLAVNTLESLLNAAGSTSAAIREGLLWGIANLYPELSRPLDDSEITEIIASSFREPQLHLIHGFGFRREHTERLTGFLNSEDPMLRGVAALSLARTAGVQAEPALQTAYREASDEFERALMACALVSCGELKFGVELHKILCRFSKGAAVWLLQNRWKWELLAALGPAGDKPYASAWSDVLGISTELCSKKLTEWKGTSPGVMSPAPPNPLGPAVTVEPRDRIFISYSHADQRFCDEFLKMIHPTAEKYGLKLWSDNKIKPGEIWREKIDEALARAKIGVLLLSPDFLQSTFIIKNELPPLLEGAAENGTKIFWIACRHCNVEDTEIGKFQGVNSPSKPLAALSRVAREKEWKRISQELLRMIEP